MDAEVLLFAFLGFVSLIWLLAPRHPPRHTQPALWMKAAAEHGLEVVDDNHLGGELAGYPLVVARPQDGTAEMNDVTVYRVVTPFLGMNVRPQAPAAAPRPSTGHVAFDLRVATELLTGESAHRFHDEVRAAWLATDGWLQLHEDGRLELLDEGQPGPWRMGARLEELRVVVEAMQQAPPPASFLRHGEVEGLQVAAMGALAEARPRRGQELARELLDGGTSLGLRLAAATVLGDEALRPLAHEAPGAVVRATSDHGLHSLAVVPLGLDDRVALVAALLSRGGAAASVAVTMAAGRLEGASEERQLMERCVALWAQHPVPEADPLLRAWLPRLDDDEQDLAVAVLAQVGTVDSVPALRGHQAQLDLLQIPTSRAIDRAVLKIQDRGGGQGGELAVAEPERQGRVSVAKRQPEG